MAPGREQRPHFPFSLRFRNSQVEVGYSDSKKALLVRRIKGLAVIHLLVSLCSVLFLVATQRLNREELLTDTAFEGYFMQALGQGSMAAFMLLVLLTSRLWEFSCGTFFLEVFTVLTTVLSMSMNTFTGPRRFVKLSGHSLDEAFGDSYDSDSGILLILDVFVTGTHLGLPIRWFVMAPLELSALALYGVVVFLIGSSEPMGYVFYNLIALFCLVLCSALGKRFAEMEERRAFLSLISEKAMRCEAEFQLSQVPAAAPQEKAADGRSEGPSEAVTDRSGAIFDPLFEKGVDKAKQLELVAEKGDSEHWRIPSTEVTLLSEEALGRGSFGSVQRAIFCGRLVAVKVPRLDELGAMRVADLCNELRILRHLRHPHIVTAHGAVVLPQEGQIYLVLELINGANLTAFLLPTNPELVPSTPQRYQVMLGVCEALLYMHSRVPHIVHGDLKSGNVMVELLNGCAVPKLLDFGLSRVINAHARSLGGTLAWVAPEVVSRAPVKVSADIYSLGRLIAFTATGLPPMQKMSQQSLLRALQRKRPPLPSWPEDCEFTPSCQPLVTACLSPSPEKRPSIQQIHKVLLGLSSSLPGDLQCVRDLAELMEGGSSIELQSLRMRPQPTKLSSLPEEEVATVPETLSPSCSGSMRSSQRRRRKRPFAELPETSRTAMQASLLEAFKRWNSCELRKCCCERHAWSKLGQELCAELLSSSCTAGRLRAAGPGTQCPNCGILDVKEGCCDLCGWEEEEEEGPPSRVSI